MTARQSDVLAQLVSDRGLVAPEALARARMVAAETGERLDSVLTRLGVVPEARLADTLAAAAGVEVATAADFPALPLPGISERFLRDVKALPLWDDGSEVGVAFADPLDREAADALSFALGRRIRPFAARASDVEAALDRLYGAVALEGVADAGAADDDDLERLKDLASDAPVIRAVNRLIARAVDARASDIHAEPAEDALTIRFRVDGVMREEQPLPSAMRQSFVSRVKVMASLNIAEKRLPQDGRLRIAVKGHEIDLRVATSPTIHGEAVVMRLLDRSELQLSLPALGFDSGEAARLTAILERPHGIVLVTGPTGSGKTTTLYAALSLLNTPARKLLTIEDPIEYRLQGINQTQVQPAIGLSFAAALRSFLRQDPDVMMVGEIRDLETADVAVQAALTGHLILSTLHTNTAASAVTRLMDMGVEPFLITSTLNAVLAQRLVRRLCAACREPTDPSDAELKALGPELVHHRPARLYHARGCPECGGSGYRGRVAIVELLTMDEGLGRLVLARAEAREIERAARAAGMRPMLADGLLKCAAGETTVEEVLRVTREG
ncbi:MAG: ATPase, T2SS/T4P/T4SS family [Sphingomonadaceae bacterium]|nr:ATPase, T2SS/T4P/T4SS family [Sphingomonadaceae bacterium]